MEVVVEVVSVAVVLTVVAAIIRSLKVDIGVNRF